ncbi:MAG: site-specific integrase, partial [Thermoplasmata archaeon]|nr:site-specific integrase [Thermoplasmata archaeon]
MSNRMELRLDSEARSARFLSLTGQDYRDSLDRFANYLELKGRTSETVRSYLRAVKHLGAWLTEEKGRKPSALWILETYDIDTCAA